ncbi:phosphoenolpyruvate synthase [Scopulibacillus darangshiensis]|uniref:Phosphoenolpyruvate synthase n=1 Tax=Scopulibacillus darangshiensis TaxID=442528 RepID=A0A4R2NVH1_9BACL|nr:phosphoenolpyruvate synthase [Scopulibacillus darangshiensis]TCP25591.1 phosphoenolpyruvate synthase [Scopulibacillus darangshiensis]
MEKYVLKFNEIDKSYLPYAGGKGANLGEMTKAGFPVPQGFCLSTFAYRTFIQTSKEMSDLFRQLNQVRYDDLEQIRVLGQRIREHLTSISMPDDIRSAVLKAWETTGKDKAYAVRSSATAEDLPTASFAGQQDTYLNVCGPDQLLKAIQNCWASLFTDRAISYRAKNNFDHRSVFLSVVVQEMVFPEVSGIMFTADPITGHRSTISIDASFGLGEALVSGLVTADLYQVRSGEIVKKQISKKEKAIYSVPEGGTVTKNLPYEEQELPALPEDKILELARLGQKIEAYYGLEQDIEWALVDGQFYILQSRPITSLYPIPPVADHKYHVFINFNYIQVMTDPIKPLAISILSNITNFLKENPDSLEGQLLHGAGGRAFADFTGALSLKPLRNRMVKILSGMDELLASALAEATSREQFRQISVPKKKVFRVGRKIAPIIIPAASKVVNNLFFKDPEKANQHVLAFIENTVKETEKKVFSVTGSDRIRMIKQGMGAMVPDVLSKIAVYLITGVIASGMLEKMLENKVGDEQAALLLSQLYKSLPGNITTEMGLAIGDLADEARKYPEVIDYLQQANSSTFYEGLMKIPGGTEFKLQLEQFLQKYGMRCAGEIDITKPRWHEDPTQLIPSIIGNIRTASPGEHRKKFKQGEQEAESAGQEIVSQFRSFEKRRVSRLVNLYRHLMGMREHHKFAVIRILYVYKRAILDEAKSLVGKGVLRREEDVFYFSLEELSDLIENRFSGNVQETEEDREKQHELNQKLKSPRVMTSDGEMLTGKRRDAKAPKGAILGTPVSAGMVEGVARVVLRPEDAKLSPGEILVAPFTDPGWTPLFTSAVGLITDVGGMMTHGSVVAREYGIPAVVGIEKATEIIKDGANIRVDGTNGFVQILDDVASE